MSVYRDAVRDEPVPHLSRAGFSNNMFSLREVDGNAPRQRLMYSGDGADVSHDGEMTMPATSTTSNSTFLGVSRSVLKEAPGAFEDNIEPLLSAPTLLPPQPYGFSFAQGSIGAGANMNEAYDILSSRDDMFTGGYIPVEDFNSGRLSDRMGYNSDNWTYQSDGWTDRSECLTPTTTMLEVASDVAPVPEDLGMLDSADMDAEADVDMDADADADADAEADEDDSDDRDMVSPAALAGSSKKGYFCDVPGCNRQQPFGSKSDLRRHKATVHKENLRGQATFLCADAACRASNKQQKLWRRKDNFKTHCKVKHPDSDLDDLMKRSQELASGHSIDPPTSGRSQDEARCYQCKGYEQTGRFFKREADLNRHLRTVHSLKEQKFDCLVPSVCGRRGSKAFQRKDHWRNHLRKFHGIQKLECGYGNGCTNVFDLAENPHEYQRHVKAFHGEDKPSRELRVPGTGPSPEIRYRHFNPSSSS